MAPPRGYQTPPVPPVAMLKNNFSAAGDPVANASRMTVAATAVIRLLHLLRVMLNLLDGLGCLNGPRPSRQQKSMFGAWCVRPKQTSTTR
jgi:hypothetical protein